jgi:predicted nucleotidyltransferase
LKDQQGGFMVKRFCLEEFGSTMLGVDSEDSDLDILVTTFDCLFDRNLFF